MIADWVRRRVAALLAPVPLVASVVLSGCAAAQAPVDEMARIAEAMRLRPGMQVADVGAGEGEYSEALIDHVGDSGHVIATEVKDDELARIRQRLEDTGRDNWTVIPGDQQETGLPGACCDAILLRLVYHHFTEPARMRASLRRALRPGARLLVVEILPQTSWSELPGVPDRGGHGITPEDLVDEMTGDGFQVLERHETWPGDTEHYGVVFVDGRSPAGDDGSTGAGGSM